MATVKFLTGTETDLLKEVNGPGSGYVNPINEGSLYVTAEKDIFGTWRSALYYDTNGKRLRVSGGGDGSGGGGANDAMFAHKILFDGTSSPGSTVVTTLRNINSVDYYNIDFPAASEISAGIITTGNQDLTGFKTFNTGGLILKQAGGFEYAGIENANSSAPTSVWFSDVSKTGTPVKDENFTYNPQATAIGWQDVLTSISHKIDNNSAFGKLKVDVVEGIAAMAYADTSGHEIATSYITKIIFDGSDGDKVTYTTTNGANQAIQDSVELPIASESFGGVITTATQIFNGDKTFLGRVYIKNNIESKADVADTGAFIIGDKDAVHLSIDANTILAKSNGTTISKLFIQDTGGETQIGGSLLVTGITRLQDELHVDKDMFLEGSFESKGIIYSNNTTPATGKYTGSAQFKGGISVNDTSYFEADTTFNSNVLINKDLTVVSNIAINGGLTINKDTLLKGALTVEGKTTLKDTLDVIGAANLANALNVSGFTKLASNLEVTGETLLKGALATESTADILGTLDVHDITTIHGNQTPAAEDATGALVVYGGIYTSNDNYFKGKLTVKGDIALDGITSLNGGVNGDLVMLTPNSSIYWNDGSEYRQRIKTTNNNKADDAVFTFQQSVNSGSKFTDLFTIQDNGVVYVTEDTGQFRKIYATQNDIPAILVGAGNFNVPILRAYFTGSGNKPTGAYGFTLKYMGEGGGIDNYLTLFADDVTASANVIGWSMNQKGDFAIGTDPVQEYKLKVNGKTLIASSEEATSAVNTSVGETGALQVTGGIRAGQASHFNRYINATEGFGVYQTEGTGAGISLYNGSNDGATPTYGIFTGKTATFGKGGNLTGAWATYFTTANTDGEGWIFRRNTTGSVEGTNNLVFIDTRGSIYSHWNGKREIHHRIKNSFGDIALKVGVESNNAVADESRGLYDHTTSTWFLYRNKTNETRMPDVLHLDNNLYVDDIYPNASLQKNMGTASLIWNELFIKKINLYDMKSISIGFLGLKDTGYSDLELGNNSTASQGRIRLYSAGAGYHEIIANKNLTSNVTLYLPEATGTLVYHTRNTAIGGGTQPTYVDATGKVIASTSGVATDTQLMYLTGGILTASKATVGDGNIPVYLAKGVITASTNTVGTTDRPMYLNAGTMTQTTYRMAATNASATTPVGIDNTPQTGIWYVNSTSGILSQGDGAAIVNVYSDKWISQIYQDYRTGQIALRGKNNGTWQAWRTVIDSSNFTTHLDSTYVNVTGDTMTGLLKITTYSVTSTFGCQNGSYNHFSTTASVGHWFNKNVYVQGNIYAGASYADLVLTAANYASTLDAKYVNVTGDTMTGALAISATTASTSTTTGALKVSGGVGVKGNLWAAKVYGAVWNDYAEFRQSDNKVEAGRVVIETKFGNLTLSTQRLQPGGNIVSDTFGFAIGKTKESKTPIAVSGRVLAYPYEDRESYEPGDAVCTGPNGTVSRMTREEIREYPERIVGTVSEIPTYETWGEDNVKVNGRIWIKVK